MATVSRRVVASGLLAMPALARAQGTTGSGTVRVGMNTVLTGPIALLGTSQRAVAEAEVVRINAAGGLAGRRVELVVRDSEGRADRAARVARDLVQREGCEILLDGEVSVGAFAVQDVVRELGVLCLHTAAEASSLTADPKLRVATAFRCARQTVHDSIVGGRYAAAVAKERKWWRWATCAPDDAYGHDTATQFIDFLRQLKPDVEVVVQAWPKLGQPDFTDVLTRLLQAKPNAMLLMQYAGDLSAFINQGRVYDLFDSVPTFGPNLGDYPVLRAVQSLPQGLRAGSRYLEWVPDTAANRTWGETYRGRTNQYPSNWAWQNATAWMFLEAAARKAGTLEARAMAEALTGLTIPCPFGADGTVTMREDHTLVDYAIGWGRTVPQVPFITETRLGSWATIRELERGWLKSKGYA